MNCAYWRGYWKRKVWSKERTAARMGVDRNNIIIAVQGKTTQSCQTSHKLFLSHCCKYSFLNNDMSGEISQASVMKTLSVWCYNWADFPWWSWHDVEQQIKNKFQLSSNIDNIIVWNVDSSKLSICSSWLFEGKRWG